MGESKLIIQRRGRIYVDDVAKMDILVDNSTNREDLSGLFNGERRFKWIIQRRGRY